MEEEEQVYTFSDATIIKTSDIKKVISSHPYTDELQYYFIKIDIDEDECYETISNIGRVITQGQIYPAVLKFIPQIPCARFEYDSTMYVTLKPVTKEDVELFVKEIKVYLKRNAKYYAVEGKKASFLIIPTDQNMIYDTFDIKL